MDQHDFDSLKARVVELEDRVKFLYNLMNVEYVEGNVAQAAEARVREQLLQCNKIEAIKIFRQIYNVGLAEAKKAVDDIERRL
jgi:ribosomal protein L7/L12